ncbi:MarR family transcriptional regulator [Tianweitania sp. BSSL-BM11]|uniref:MarR family transcriptional regulator n=1 Tax=Tianweitania aestuarii TaxID=2814886 RepID=A0ABS5RTK5_9HYPH|nr:MarR family transcriptional regulator [Tianweitania aestuarii]MBS9720140.1 MarR family transcriptional regulator [Tianweitania aestuarii]
MIAGLSFCNLRVRYALHSNLFSLSKALCMSEASVRSSFLPQLGVVTRKMRTLYDAQLKTQELSLSRARLLFHLSAREGATQKELASLLAVEQPSMVTLIDAMEKSGFIRRVALSSDRRSKGIFMTDRAREATTRLMRLTEEFNEMVLAGIDDAELAVVQRVLQRMFDNISEAG